MDPTESTPEPVRPPRRLQRGVLTAGAVVAMVLAGLGVAGAQTGDAPTSTTAAAESAEGKRVLRPGKAHLDTAAEAIGIPRSELLAQLEDGKSIAQVAQSKDVDPQKVIDAVVAAVKADLAERVQAGDITQAQADAKAENLAARITELVNREGLPAHGPGKGHRHRGGPGHHAKANLDVAANTIGVSFEELRSALEDGRSIAQVAESEDVEVQKVVDAMVADAKEHLADAVKSGRLTQAQADERLERITEHTTEVVNREGLPERGRGKGPGRMRMGTGAEPANA